MNGSASNKRIAIIGAGICGITSTKACLEQNLTPVVFEKMDYICGLWHYSDTLDVDGIPSVMKSTVINTSKEISAFSDYPPPIELSNYMHNTKLAKYFESYAETFNFKNYVKFRHEVISVEMANDFETSGRWVVNYRSMESNEKFSELFDGVMICTGHHGTVHMATFSGQEQFKGTIMHTHSLKSNKGFEDKVVVIVGIGNSAGDAAVELSTVTKQLYLSTRRGSWVTKRVGKNGLPTDSILLRRYFTYSKKFVPGSVTSNFFENDMNQFFDHELFQLKPKHRADQQHPMINDALPNRILSGTVVVKGDIDHFTSDGVVFKGETEVTKCDVVIMATGYKIRFPFLSQKILPVTDNSLRLYKFQYIPNLKHAHTLAVIGLIQPVGPIFPIAELQSRWYAQLMAGNLKLPSQSQMEADIDYKLDCMKKRYYGSVRHTIQVDWVEFMDELAAEVGVMPPIWKYLFTDFRLFWALMFEPSAPYQYRLVGPNSWKDARKTQLSVNRRILAALRTNKSFDNYCKEKTSNWFYLVNIVFVVIFLSIIMHNYVRN